MHISIGTIIPTAMITLSAMTVSSCGNKINKGIEGFFAPYDSTKANLPIIDGNKVIYKNIDGDVIVIESGRKEGDAYTKRMTSLYQAIMKFSTKESPNITEPEKFYTEVEKNIPKNIDSKYLIISDNLSSIKSIQASNLLSELYDMFTEDDSEQGKTITVNEYTQMMDAWSSTGIRK